MQISPKIATEIFSNAEDLQFVINEANYKFAVVIQRGINHKFKIIVATDFIFVTMDKAVEYTKTLLDAILKTAREETAGSNTLTNLTPNILSEELIERICIDLACCGRAQTH